MRIGKELILPTHVLSQLQPKEKRKMLFIESYILYRIPHTTWVKYLEVGDIIWLAKEECFACIRSKFQEHDSRGYNLPGDISIIYNDIVSTQQKWTVRADGTGLDNKQLFWPLKQLETKILLRSAFIEPRC